MVTSIWLYAAQQSRMKMYYVINGLYDPAGISASISTLEDFKSVVRVVELGWKSDIIRQYVKLKIFELLFHYINIITEIR